jgi:hypothetical protein
LIPNPILKVLSTLSFHEVRYLLMGGQACVFYGAAEFSRDCDIAILCKSDNLARLQAALNELQAVNIAVPPFELDYLLRGHAVHFRCRAADAQNIRVDVMAKMRGVAPFEELWSRRTTLFDERFDTRIEVLSLADLVAAKQTQRDKDWPMIRRLIEADYAQHRSNPTDAQVSFWLRSSRSPEMLIELVENHPEIALQTATNRPAIAAALQCELTGIRNALTQEQQAEGSLDEEYWLPLKRELEQLRRRRP